VDLLATVPFLVLFLFVAAATESWRRNTAFLGRWVGAVNSGDIKTVCRLYHLRSISFLPTFCGQHIKTHEGVLMYMIHFLAKRPQCRVVEEVHHNFLFIFVTSGIYEFKVEGSDHPLVARFSFVVVFGRAIQHHSSVKPPL